MIRYSTMPVIAILLLVSGCAGTGERRDGSVSLPAAGVVKQVKIWYTEYQLERTIRTRIGDMSVYRDYSMQFHTVRPQLDSIITGCYNRLKGQESLSFRYETRENGAYIKRVAKVTRDDPEYIGGLLQNLEREVNSIKEQENIDPGQKVVFEYY